MKTKRKKMPDNNWKNNLQAIVFVITQWVKECVTFILIIIKPWNLLLIFITIGVIYYSQAQIGTNRLIFEIISAFLSSFTGGIITYYFIEFVGNSSLVRKSGGAIRNLQLIKYKVANINNRVVDLTTNNNKRDFEEVSNLVQNVNKDILNSIGDWRDVNPASDAIVDFYELVSQAESASRSKSREIVLLEERLNKAKEEEIPKLEKEIEKRNKELSEIQKNVYELNTRYVGYGSGSMASSASLSPPLSVPSSQMYSGGGGSGGVASARRTCRNCGRNYFNTSLLFDNGLCDSCRMGGSHLKGDLYGV